MRWVRPLLTTSANSSALRDSDSSRCCRAGMRSRTIAPVAATWIADGKTSLDDCEALTWSLGCTGLPSASVARVAMTSLVFMLLDVPEPVWKTSIGKCSSQSPCATSPRRLGDRAGDLGVEHAEVGVDAGGRALDGGEGADQLPLDGGAGDREVLDGALRLGPPLGPRRDAHLSHGVVLDAVVGAALVCGRPAAGPRCAPGGVDGDSAPGGTLDTPNGRAVPRPAAARPMNAGPVGRTPVARPEPEEARMSQPLPAPGRRTVRAVRLVGRLGSADHRLARRGGRRPPGLRRRRRRTAARRRRSPRPPVRPAGPLAAESRHRPRPRRRGRALAGAVGRRPPGRRGCSSAAAENIGRRHRARGSRSLRRTRWASCPRACGTSEYATAGPVEEHPTIPPRRLGPDPVLDALRAGVLRWATTRPATTCTTSPRRCRTTRSTASRAAGGSSSSTSWPAPTSINRRTRRPPHAEHARDGGGRRCRAPSIRTADHRLPRSAPMSQPPYPPQGGNEPGGDQPGSGWDQPGGATTRPSSSALPVRVSATRPRSSASRRTASSRASSRASPRTGSRSTASSRASRGSRRTASPRTGSRSTASSRASRRTASRASSGRLPAAPAASRRRATRTP